MQAESGQEALSIIQQHSNICLMISDFHIPTMNSLQLFYLLKQSSYMKKIPMFMITENTSYALRRQAMRDGAVAILYKPYTQHELFYTLNRVFFYQLKISVLAKHSTLRGGTG